MIILRHGEQASVPKASRLMLFKETVAVYFENHVELTSILCEQNVEFLYVEAGDTYSN
jgi:hypothetical protein